MRANIFVDVLRVFDIPPRIPRSGVGLGAPRSLPRMFVGTNVVELRNSVTPVQLYIDTD